MADLSAIQIPGGSVLNIKDAEARAGYAIATPTLASGTYSLANRTVNKLALTSGSSITVAPPEGVSGHAPDCLLDIDNSDNSSAVQVTCSGAVLAVPGGIDITSMMTVPAQSRARFAFTGLGLTVPQSSGSSTQVPLMSVRRILYSVDASWVTHPDAPEGDGMVDESLSSTSENPVQNKTVTAALDGKTDLSVIAPEFDSTDQYTVGSFVIHEGVLYQCTTAHQGAWDAAHFTATDVNTALQAAASSGSSVSPSSATPLMDGTAAVGSENAYARGDHRHPTDTSLMPKMATGTANYFTVSKTDGTIQRSYYTPSSFAAQNHTHSASSVYTSYRSSDVESVLSELESRLSTVESECCGGGGAVSDAFITLGTVYYDSMYVSEPAAYPGELACADNSMVWPDPQNVAPCLMAKASELLDPSMGDFTNGGDIKSEYQGITIGAAYENEAYCTTAEFVLSLYDNTCYGNVQVMSSMDFSDFVGGSASIGFLVRGTDGDWWVCFPPKLDMYGTVPSQSWSPDQPGDLAYALYYAVYNGELTGNIATITGKWGSYDSCMGWDEHGCFGYHEATVDVLVNTSFSPSGGCC